MSLVYGLGEYRTDDGVERRVCLLLMSWSVRLRDGLINCLTPVGVDSRRYQVRGREVTVPIYSLGWWETREGVYYKMQFLTV